MRYLCGGSAMAKQSMLLESLGYHWKKLKLVEVEDSESHSGIYKSLDEANEQDFSETERH